MKEKNFDLIYSEISEATQNGVGHLTTESHFESNQVKINGGSKLNFALCDYFNLSSDDRIKKGAIEAVSKYGTYTAISKTFLKLDIYEKAEESVSRIFNKPCLLFPRTTFAHLGILPIITDTKDAILLDHQVHASMKMAADIAKCYGTYCETIRHINTTILEERIIQLSTKYKKIWYLTDSIYSMLGDYPPIEDFVSLLNKYDQFRLYVDDAHGMSWCGQNGSGFLLSKMNYHPHLILITSLGKGFGAGGGAAIFYDDTIKDKIKICSPPLMFSSPVSPATLGAIIESSKVHLSNDIYTYQSELNKNIIYFINLSKQLDIPIVDQSPTPIFYIAAGKPEMASEIMLNLLEKGIFISAAMYPAVPYNNSGIRITLNRTHSTIEIEYLLTTIKEIYLKALNRRGLSNKDILKFFKNMNLSHMELLNI